MKILYIITQADGGGAQKYVLALAGHFGGEIACGSEKTTLFDQASSLGIKTYKLKYLKRDIHPLFDILALIELIRLVKTTKPNIVHLNSTKAGFLGSLIKPFVKSKTAPRTGQRSWTGARVIFTAHGFRFLEPLSPFARLFYLFLEKFASLFRDYIIAVSEKDKQSALDNNLIGADKISTIHNGIPAINFLGADEARQRLNIPKDKFIFGCISNFYKTKGLDVLAEAVNLLSDDIKNNSLFVIIGDGPERRNLELGIRYYELGNAVKLLGKIDAANKYLKAFDCFILPSRKEGFPFALLEAMQAGLPILATSAGGIPEALNHAAILIEPENPQALAKAVSDALRDEQKRKNLSQKALERSSIFTEQKMLKETKMVYEKLLRLNKNFLHLSNF